MKGASLSRSRRSAASGAAWPAPCSAANQAKVLRRPVTSDVVGSQPSTARAVLMSGRRRVDPPEQMTDDEAFAALEAFIAAG